MSTPSFDALTFAWREALPAVLRLMGDQQRSLFRHELQRFLATSRFQPDSAQEAAPQLHGMLLVSLRAARQPAALNLTRSWPLAVDEMVRLCELLLALWIDAVEMAAVAAPECDPAGLSGPVYFGPRLGGPGRPGAAMPEPGPDD